MLMRPARLRPIVAGAASRIMVGRRPRPIATWLVPSLIVRPRTIGRRTRPRLVRPQRRLLLCVVRGSPAPLLLALSWSRRSAVAGQTTAQPQRLAALALVVVRVPNHVEYRVGVRSSTGCSIATLEACPRRERVLLKELPHLFGIRQATRVRNEPREEAVHVFDVTKEQLSRVGVARAIHRLWEVDDDRSVGSHEDVEVRKVAVDHAGGEHPDHFLDQSLVHRSRGLGLEDQVGEAGRRVAVSVDDELHDQDTVDEVARHRHSDPRRVQAMDHVDLGRPPGRLVLRAPVLRPLSDRSLVSRVPDVSTLGVLRTLSEGAVLSLFVDLRNALRSTRHHEIDLGFLSTHQGAAHLVEDALVVERSERIGDAHAGVIPPYSSGASRCGIWTALGLQKSRRPLFERILSFNPNDNQGVRFCWEDVRHGRSWEAMHEREDEVRANRRQGLH